VEVTRAGRGKDHLIWVFEPVLAPQRDVLADCLTMPYAVDRPKPVPLPCSLVVKKGSNNLGKTSLGMPPPLSSTTKTV